MKRAVCEGLGTRGVCALIVLIVEGHADEAFLRNGRVPKVANEDVIGGDILNAMEDIGEGNSASGG